MKILRDGTALRQLSVLFNEGVTGAETDGQLLERFATRRGEASEHAFATLVERHGPVVLRLCRSVLRDEHEAQDAFQATFLVLAQRAGSLWVRDSIGPWIHSVAYRVASCARAAGIRRQRHERRHAELAAGRLAVYHDEDREDLEAVVHEEIDRLPEHYRAPLILCDLEGCTHEQAARSLGWPVGTVKSRQARGRQRLRDRLIRRGLSPSCGMTLGGGVLTPELPVPAALTKATTNLATIWAGADSARVAVAVLAREVLKVMVLQKIKQIVLSLSMISLTAAGAGGLLWRAMAARPGEGQATSAKPAGGQAAAVAKRERTGKIYISVNRRLMELDPNTGTRADVFDGCSMRPRVSPDGKSVAFGRENALWVRGLDPKAEPRKVADLGVYSGAPAAWSPDGKQIIINAGRKEKSDWVFTTFRVNTDGTGREKPAIPPEDGVQDWSADGRWLLTASHRGANLGWQLYVMRPDGTVQRRITEGGNPFYARFSPDGRRVVYTDNGRDEQSGIWVADVDGKNGRLVLPVETKPKADAVRIGSACWSPDGQRIAVLLSTLEESQTKVAGWVQVLVVVVMDLDGGHRSEILHIPDGGGNDMPEMADWR
jgi:RNA polymerase sigma factor (sigma-70 family)